MIFFVVFSCQNNGVPLDFFSLRKKSSPDLSGFGAVAGQNGVSAPFIDFLLGSGLETG